MKKLAVSRSEAMLFRMLSGRWMADSNVARILHCKENEAYDKVREIACKQKLYPMRIEEGQQGGWIIVLRPRAKVTVLRFVSILPQ